MTRIIVARDDVIKVIEEWLKEMKVQPNDKFEIRFGEGEMSIRPLLTRDLEMLARVHANMTKFADALSRLADS